MTKELREKFKKEAMKTIKKSGTPQMDVDLSKFSAEQQSEIEISDLEQVDEEFKKILLNVGVDPQQKERSGTYIQTGNQVAFCKTKSDKVEVLPIAVALEKYEWLQDYYWKAVSVDTDRYTAETELTENLQGYFIHAKKGAKDIFPLQSCLFLDIEGMKQIVHNIIIAEEESELNLITGCTVHPNVRKALHLGVSEFYLKKNSKISFTMIHYWSDKSEVRPRTAIIQEEGSVYNSNYIVMSPVRSLQSNPIAYLNGDGAKSYFQTLVYAKQDSYIDVGSRAVLNGKNSKSEMISRIIATGKSHVIARALIQGNASGATGHLECQGLVLSPNARIHAIPEIDATNPNVTLTHEAAVGKIAEEQIMYLMSRGLNEDEARDLIIGGFLEADTSHLPKELAEETKKLINIASEAEG
ncbi:MAG: SufD family Fe-S cluster assembly protein [Candidatus Lokiarchaeota archaeon]|nr:SufD family Fe-S cluster assembly protein [Candidatus Lokiarchaeota archaeon]